MWVFQAYYYRINIRFLMNELKDLIHVTIFLFSLIFHHKKTKVNGAFLVLGFLHREIWKPHLMKILINHKIEFRVQIEYFLGQIFIFYAMWDMQPDQIGQIIGLIEIGVSQSVFKFIINGIFLGRGEIGGVLRG
jgi:hypothetical protein